MQINGTVLNSLVSTAGNLSTREASISAELSSGVRITALSDDPAAVGTNSTLQSELAQTDSFLASASTATARGQAADSALGSVVTALTSAISTAVRGESDTLNASDRQALGTQLSSLRDSLLALANSSYAGQYLFSGTSGTTAPFSIDSTGNVTYAGDSHIASLATIGGGAIATSIDGATIFGAGSGSVFGTLQSAIAALNSGNAPGSGAVSALHDALDQVTTQRASFDSGLTRLNQETTYTTALQTNLKVQQSALIADDPTALATELSADQTQRQALLSTISIVEKGSLFDYL